MGYRQPGYGNGKKPSSIPSSPLNLRSKRKQEEFRSKMEGRSTKKGKFRGVELESERALPSQYQNMSKNKRNKLMSKAAEKAASAQAKLDSGKKLSAREQRFIDENNYNTKRKQQLEASKAEKQSIRDKEREYKESGQVHTDRADRLADALKQLGPDAGDAGDAGRRFNPGGTNLKDLSVDPSMEYHGDKVHGMSGDKSYVSKSFMEKHPDLARKFGLREGSRMDVIPLAKDGGVRRPDAKQVDQIPVDNNMEIKRPVRQEPVVKKPVVEKKKVEEKKPKVTKEKESLYDSQYMVPEGTRSSTTMTSMTDPTHWMEGRSALNFKGRKNKKYKK